MCSAWIANGIREEFNITSVQDKQVKQQNLAQVLRYLRRWVPVDARVEVVRDSVPVEEALVAHHVLRLQTDLHHVQRGHEQRHWQERTSITVHPWI